MPWQSLDQNGGGLNPNIPYTWTALQSFTVGIAMGGPITWPGSGPDAHDTVLNTDGSGNVSMQGQTFIFKNDNGNPAPIDAGGPINSRCTMSRVVSEVVPQAHPSVGWLNLAPIHQSG